MGVNKPWAGSSLLERIKKGFGACVDVCVSSKTRITFARMETRLESMEEAMALYIQFIEERHANDIARQADEYAGLLLCISSGSWAFPQEFTKWRAKASATDTLAQALPEFPS